MTQGSRLRGLVAWAAFLGAATLSVCAGSAVAQSRNSVYISDPGLLRPVGRSGGSSTSVFEQYSSGLGALGQATSAPLGGGSVLESSMGYGTSLYVSSDPLDSSANSGIANRGLLNSPISAGIYGAPAVESLGGSYSRQIGGSTLGPISVADPVRSPLGNSPLVTKPVYQDLTDPLSPKISRDWTAPSSVGRSSYTPGGPIGSALGDGLGAALPGTFVPQGLTPPGGSSLVSDVAGPGAGNTLAAQVTGPTAFGLARGFVQALEQASASLLRQQGEPITTLVPRQESIYRTYMLRGDRAFRQGNYREAYANFQIANDLGNKDPESLICLLHAEFALSTVSYAKACYFLEQALRYMPELPMANLRPRGFYESQARYAQQLVALQEYIARNPSDHEAMLILAYFRWFEQERDVQGMKDLLSRALAVAEQKKDTLLIEAIGTFWRGAVATGAVAGDLEPRPATAPETMPAP